MLTAAASVACAQGVPIDDFESYADQSAFEGVWLLRAAGNVLVTGSTGHSGANYVEMTVSAAENWRSISVTPTDADPWTLDFWIRPRVAGQNRHYMRLDDNTAGNIAALGQYNTPASTGWFARLLGGPSWVAIGGTRVVDTWTHLQAVMKTTTMDCFENGAFLMTLTKSADFGTLTEFEFGDTLTSTPGSDDVDDVGLVQGNLFVEEWSLY